MSGHSRNARVIPDPARTTTCIGAAPSEVNKIRWMIEQVISHFKNWTIMHTDYRRPLKTFETTISAVVGLHFYRTV